MRRELRQLDGDLGRGQHHVDHACRDRRARHAVVLRRLRFLRERDAPGRLDLANADRPVGGRARENDADGAALRVFGQRGQERVDRRVLRSVVGPGFR